MSKFTMIIITLVLLDLVAGGIFHDIINWIWIAIWGAFIVFLIVFHFTSGDRKHNKMLNKNREG